MSNETKTHLTAEQVNHLNQKHGWFQFADAQGAVSRAFAQEAIEMPERMRAAAPELLSALKTLAGVVGDQLAEEHDDGSLYALALALAAIEKAEGKP